MSYLPNLYREENLHFGHAMNCAFGAGADCNCGKFDYSWEDEPMSVEEQQEDLVMDFYFECFRVLEDVRDDITHTCLPQEDDLPF